MSGDLRTAPVALALALIASAPLGAAAQDGRCAAILGVGFAWEPGVLDSVDPAELESPDPVAAPRDEPAPLPAEAALACSGTTDVRCQPLHESDAPTAPRIARSGPEVALAAPAALPRWRGIRLDRRRFGPGVGTTSGRDVVSDLFRPPRG